MSTQTEVKHTPGDVNHKVLAAAGYDFCTTCGCSLRGKRTALETEMLEALEAIQSHWQSGNFSRRQDLWDAMDAAINKARGGQ